MPGVIFVSLVMILPHFGVSGNAVWIVALSLAAWSWLCGRMTRSVAGFSIRNQLSCIGLFLTLATAVMGGFFGSIAILSMLADSLPADISLGSDALCVPLFVFVVSNAVRIAVNAVASSAGSRR
jgi:hypothetical protein